MKTIKNTGLAIICLFLFTNSINGQLSFKKVKEAFSTSNENSGTTSSTSGNSASIASNSSDTSPIFNNKGREWYVSATNGSGQLGTKEKPARDMANIIHLLKPNDIINIAAGTYMSKGARGADEINIPVKIYGGFDETFSQRDPWGTLKTIFTGTNEYLKSTDPRIYIRTDQQRESNGQLSTGSEIVVDGIIIDNGPRNRYHENKGLAIRRQASEKSGQNPSPESGGIVIVASKYTNVTVKNCVVMNTAPTEGAISVRLFHAATGIIQNNFCINNTGYGIQLRSGYTGSDASLTPKFFVAYNTVLFSWKHDAIASYGGEGLSVDHYLTATIQNNVFGFGDFGGVYNKGSKIIMNDNLFTGNSKYDYKEINAKMKVDYLLDESTLIDQNSSGNIAALIKIPVADRWAKIYSSRVEISRADIEASVHASNSGANQLRSMLGINLQGGDSSMDAEVFLPKIELEEAMPAGMLPWDGKGCQKP